MASPLQKILSNLTLSYPACFSHKELIKILPRSETEALLNMGILREGKPMETDFCPSCREEHDIVVRSQTYAFMVCTDEHTGRITIDPKTLKTWQLHIPALLNALQTSLGVKTTSTIDNLTDTLWQLSSHTINGKKYHLFFTHNINAIERDKKSIITHLPDSAVFYIGIPTKSLPKDVLLVPLLEIVNGIHVKQNKLRTGKKALEHYFQKEIFIDETGDIPLDGDIILAQEKNRLHLNRNESGGFEKSIPIPPQATHIIAYLYQIRNYPQRTRTLEELANTFAKGSKVSIPNRINFIQNLPTEHGIKPILYKNSNDEWGAKPAT